MPLIDLHCHLGVTRDTLALRAPDVRAASAYADQFGVETLCFSSALASSDLDGGTEDLVELLGYDARFRGWLSLSIHQTELSAELARRYLVKPAFCGALLEQTSDADALSTAGGREVLNALRRYSRPVLISVSSPATLAAAVHAAREFSTLKFLISPQDEYLTRVAATAIKEAVNCVFLPVAAFAERDVIATAIAILGERRVAWASDWGRYVPAAALGMIRDSALTGPQRERVGLRNAREILA
ncbi:MAG TPA: amidohydrolase family protein [Abditibacterium sp.]|jgi:predicted TIM-barrel fold metal-dependent hydrolase